MYQPQTLILKYCMIVKSISRGLHLTTHTHLVFIIEIEVDTEYCLLNFFLQRISLEFIKF